MPQTRGKVKSTKSDARRRRPGLKQRRSPVRSRSKSPKRNCGTRKLGKNEGYYERQRAGMGLRSFALCARAILRVVLLSLAFSLVASIFLPLSLSSSRDFRVRCVFSRRFVPCNSLHFTSWTFSFCVPEKKRKTTKVRHAP